MREAQNGRKSAAPQRTAGYRTVCIVFFILALGGLFVGLIGKLNSSLTSAFFGADPKVPKELNGSLLGFLWDYFRALFAKEISFDGNIISALAELLLFLMLITAVVSAVVCLIVSLTSKKRAKSCALVSSVLVTLAYLAFFFYGTMIKASAATALLPTAENVTLGAEHVEICTLFIVLLSLFTIVPMTVVRNGTAGGVHAFGLLLSLVALFGCFYPGSFSLLWLREFIAKPETSFKSIAVLLLFGCAAFNVVFSVSRTPFKKGLIADAVRFTVFLVLALIFLVAVAVEPALDDPAKAIGFTAFFTMQTVPALLLLVPAVLGCVFYLAYGITAVFRRRREETQTRADGIGEKEEAKPDLRAPTYITNITPYGAPVGAQPAAAPYPYAPALPAEGPASEFEQHMIALARGEAPAPAPVPAAQPAAGVQPAAVPQPAPSPGDYYGQYIYDTFFSGLTLAEKNEFGDLFIGKKYGDFGLPTYRIGEDNAEFFRTFFIYLGKIRPHISSALLSKIYAYINRK